MNLRSLAIDFGARRIGLALSDEGGRWATPHDVLFVTDPAQAIEPILKLIETEAVQRVIVGVPLNMDGSSGPGAAATIRWAATLKAAAVKQRIDFDLIFVDERLSTFQAEQTLTARKRVGEKLTRKKKQQRLDAVAAAGFLQAYLDGKLPPLSM